MKPEQLYQELKDLAEKMGIDVREQNLRKTGIHVNSGLCKVKEKDVFIMDKHESLHGKNKLLAACLCEFPHEEIYILPVVREFLVKHRKRSDNQRKIGDL